MKVVVKKKGPSPRRVISPRATPQPREYNPRASRSSNREIINYPIERRILGGAGRPAYNEGNFSPDNAIFSPRCGIIPSSSRKRLVKSTARSEPSRTARSSKSAFRKASVIAAAAARLPRGMDRRRRQTVRPLTSPCPARRSSVSDSPTLARSFSLSLFSPSSPSSARNTSRAINLL